MKNRKRLGSENVMEIDDFADGNAISDLNSEFRRKRAGDYQAGTKSKPKGKPGDNQERRNQEETKSKPRRNQEGAPGGKQEAIEL